MKVQEIAQKVAKYLSEKETKEMFMNQNKTQN